MKKQICILSLLAILGAMNVFAATYGKLYQTHERRPRAYYVTQVGTPAQLGTSMPIIAMSTMNASMMHSGSALPMAAVTGTKTSYDHVLATTSRRAKREDSNGDGWEDDEDPDNPANPFPLGDAAIPLLVLAAAYALQRVYRRKRSV